MPQGRLQQQECRDLHNQLPADRDRLMAALQTSSLATTVSLGLLVSTLIPTPSAPSALAPDGNWDRAKHFFFFVILVH